MGCARAGHTLPCLRVLAAGRGGGAGRPPPAAPLVVPQRPQRVFPGGGALERHQAPGPARGQAWLEADEGVFQLRPARPAASEEMLGVPAGRGASGMILILVVFLLTWLTRPGSGDYQWE